MDNISRDTKQTGFPGAAVPGERRKRELPRIREEMRHMRADIYNNCAKSVYVRRDLPQEKGRTGQKRAAEDKRAGKTTGASGNDKNITGHM